MKWIILQTSLLSLIILSLFLNLDFKSASSSLKQTIDAPKIIEIRSPKWIVPQKDSNNIYKISSQKAYLDIINKNIKLLQPDMNFIEKEQLVLKIISQKGEFQDQLSHLIFKGSAKFISYKNEYQIIGHAQSMEFFPMKNLLIIKDSAILNYKNYFLEAEEIVIDTVSMEILKSINPRMKTNT